MLGDAKNRYECGLVYLFALLACVGIAPSGVVRFLNGEVVHALLDFGIVSVAVIGAIRTYKIGHVTLLISGVAAAFYSLGAVAVFYLHGPLFLLWLAPVIIANFFLLNLRAGLAVNLISILSLLPGILKLSSRADIISVASSLLICGCMAYVFALLTSKQHQLLQAFATQDPLTHLENRRSMNDELKKCIAEYHRTGIPASLIMLDLDFFKRVNDKFGHKAGDEVLVNVGKLLLKRVRSNDRAFRFGGEEFVVIARNTSRDDAAAFAEQLRELISTQVKNPESNMTASFGCAQLHPNETQEEWFVRADQAVYRAKQNGRNRVMVSD